MQSHEKSTCTTLTKAMNDTRNNCKSVESTASSRATSAMDRIKLLTRLGDNADLLASTPTIIKAPA